MAMIDYGCVVKHNGRIINENQMFLQITPEQFKEWGTTKDAAFYDDAGKQFAVLDGDFFAVFGEKDFLFAVYKNNIYQLFQDKDDCNKYTMAVLLNDAPCNYKCEKRYYFGSIGNENESRKYIVVETKHNRWDVIFGYGIDSNYKCQLDTALQYGIDIEGIEEIAEFWYRPVYVKGISLKKRNGLYDRKYTYKRIKPEFILEMHCGTEEEDKEDGGTKIVKDEQYTAFVCKGLDECLNITAITAITDEKELRESILQRDSVVFITRMQYEMKVHGSFSSSDNMKDTLINHVIYYKGERIKG